MDVTQQEIELALELHRRGILPTLREGDCWFELGTEDRPEGLAIKQWEGNAPEEREWVWLPKSENCYPWLYEHAFDIENSGIDGFRDEFWFSFKFIRAGSPFFTYGSTLTGRGETPRAALYDLMLRVLKREQGEEKPESVPQPPVPAGARARQGLITDLPILG